MIAFGLRPFHFPSRSSILYRLVLAYAPHKMLMTKSSECVRQTTFFFLFTPSISFVPRYEKTPKSTLGGAYKFLCWGIIKFARACLLLHLFYACTACFNVVDNGQLNLGERIRGVRPMNPKSFDHYAGNATVNEYRIFWIIKWVLFLS